MTRQGARAWVRRVGPMALVAGAVASACAGGCGGAAPEATPPKAGVQPAAASTFDPCEGKSPPAKAYEGLAREARCEQEVFLTMAATAGALGRDCDGCHVRKEGGGKDDLDYPVMTDQKRTANWMKHTFVDRLRHKDGSPVKCASCHKVGAQDGKPHGRFLGQPRDKKYAMEWMNLVMVNEFQTADGGKVTCKLCHGGLPSTAAFQTKVILSDGLVKLPVRNDLPPPGRVPEAAPAPAPAAPAATPPAGAPPPAASPPPPR